MIGSGLQHEQIAQASDEVEREAAQVLPLVDERRDGREQAREVSGDEPLDDVGDGAARCRAEDLRDMLGGDRTTGVREHLLEDGERVAHRSVAGADDRVDRGLLDAAALRSDDAHDMRGDVLRVDAPEVEPLHTGEDRRQDLLRVRRRHREQHVTRRLLDELEQRVERGGRGHVDLVEDVDLATSRRRRELRALAQVTRVVDATVRGHVELDDVERRARRDRHARLAGPAGRRRRTVDAVDRLREDARDRGLARAARSGEEVRVVEPVLGDGVGERAHDRRLADDVGEGTGPVAAVQRLVRHPAVLPWDVPRPRRVRDGRVGSGDGRPIGTRLGTA